MVSEGLGRLPPVALHAGIVDSESHGEFVPQRHLPLVQMLSIGGSKPLEPPQAGAKPHLHTPDSQVSEFPVHGALVPHLQIPLTHAPDFPQITPRQGSK